MLERDEESEGRTLQKRGSVLQVTGEVRTDEPFTDLELPGGQIVHLPTHLLMPAQSANIPALSEDGIVIPVLEESLTVSKRTVETAKVILRKSVEEVEQAVDEPLTVRTYEVERVALNQTVATVPEARREGLTTIYPVVEERLVLTRELVLVEEVRVTERVEQRRDAQLVKLRREQVDVERVPTASTR